MDNQHRKITGYRELSAEDIELINQIKAVGAQLDALCEQVFDRTIAEIASLPAGEYFEGLLDSEEATVAKTSADALNWLDSGRQDLRVGLMKLTRAVAKPSSF